MISLHKDINDNDEQAIALVGIGCRLPGGSRTAQQFYQQLVDGLDGISNLKPDERWSKSYVDQGYISSERAGYLDMKEWTHFDSQFFGILPKEASVTDPQIRLFLQVLWEALEDAHIDPASIRGSQTSIFLGQMYESFTLMQNNRDPTSMNPQTKVGRCDTSIKASYSFDFRGPSYSIDTACSSSLIAVLNGIQTIRSGECDISICGGMNAFLDPTNSIIFTSLSMLGKRGVCSSFDASADGYVRSEGVGVVVLKRLSKAIKDNDNIYCIVKGGNYNTDGYLEKSSPTAPSVASQAINTRDALRNVGLSPSDIYYVECHGTGTPTGDPLEISSIAKVFKGSHTKDNPLRIGSVKSNIGHTESTSGVASLIKCAMMLKNRMLIKNINFKQLNPKIDLLDGEIKIVLENEPLPDDRIIRMSINAFGITGSNSHVIVEEYRTDKDNETSLNQGQPSLGKDYLIPFSANSKKSMNNYIEMISNNISQYRDKMTFEDFVRAQSSSKTNHPPCKKVIVASDWESFLKKVKNGGGGVYEKEQTSTSNILQLSSRPSASVVMVFCGQGAQWSGMGEGLYNHFQVFKQWIDHVDQLLSNHFNYSILKRLRECQEDTKSIHHPIIAQPSTFMIQVALVQLYQHFGIKPSMVVGHSFGDVTAAWCSGIISLEEACRVVYFRSVAQNNTIKSGRMLSISLSYDQYKERFNTRYDDVELACYNSNDSIVLAGNEAQLESINQNLKNENIFSAFLGTPCAFHTSKQKQTKQFIFDNLNNINYQQERPTIPYFSTTTSRLIRLSSEFNVKYIYYNLRRPVLFQQTISNMISHIKENGISDKDKDIFLEIAPHSTLSYYLKTLLKPLKSTMIFSPLNKKKDEVECIQSCLANLYFNGINVEFSNQLPISNGNEWKDRTRHLPRYQWDSEYLWEEQPKSRKVRLEGVSVNLLGIPEFGSPNIYESTIDVGRPSYRYLKGHKVKGRYLFPGSGYIENIINAFQGKDIHIHHLRFISPFFLKEGVQSKLKSTFTNNSASDYQILFEYLDNKTLEWVKSAIGRLTIRNSTPTKANPQQYPPIIELKKQFNIAEMTKIDIYQKLTKVGLSYGETFKRVNKIYIDQNGRLLSQVDSEPKNQFEQTNTILNASVLDCILHASLVKFQGEHPDCEVVFDRVENIRIFSNRLPNQREPCDDRQYLYSVLKSSQQKGNEFYGSNDIIDENGNVLVCCGKVVCKSLTKVLKIHQAKHQSKTILKSIFQPKNSPSILVKEQDKSSDWFNNLETFICESIKSHQVVRILDSTFDDIIHYRTPLIITDCIRTLASGKDILVDYNILGKEDPLQDSRFDKICTKAFDVNIDEPLLDQGLMYSSYDLILSTREHDNLLQQYYQLLNPNGTIIFGQDSNNDNGDGYRIYRKPSISEIKLVPSSVDNILFITSSSSSSLPKRLIQQSTLFSNNIRFLSLNDIINEEKNQSIFDSNIIINLESLEEMDGNNLTEKTMHHLYLHQQLRKHHHQDSGIETSSKRRTKLITLISSPLNICLVPIGREYQRALESGFDTISIILEGDSCDHVNLDQILQVTEYESLGEQEFKFVYNNNEIEVMVERLLQSPDTFEKDSRFIISNKNDLQVIFEKDGNYHIRARPSTLQDNEIEFEVKAASINFKDVVMLDGGIPQELYSRGDYFNPPFGQDASGIVTRIGKGITKYKVGDEIYGISHGCFASHAITVEIESLPKPKEISFIEAASMVAAVGTAYCSLYQKANIDENDSILVHRATGAVGLSILNLLKCKNHKGMIFTTIGNSVEKKRYLEDNYSGLITAILGYDDFPERIMELTNGCGVNYVVNTLDRSRIQDNFNSLSPNGTLIDLSIDQFSNLDNLDMTSFKYERNYITNQFGYNYFKVQKEIETLILNHGLELPPIPTFECQDIDKALQAISSRKYIGILDFENCERNLFDRLYKEQQKIIERNEYTLDGVQDTLLITGQTGLAIESLQYIIKHSNNLRDIIIISYSKPKYEAQLLMNFVKQEKNHIKCHFIQCDISNLKSLYDSINQLYSQNPSIKPVKSVIHFANAYVTTGANEIGLKDHQTSMGAKAIGAFNLHTIFLKLGWTLNHFHMVSSMAQYASGGNTSYNVANSFLDGLVAYRRERGLEGNSVLWGSIGSAGLLSIDKGADENVNGWGLNKLKLSSVYGVIRSSLINNKHKSLPHIICADIDFNIWINSQPNISHRLSHLLLPTNRNSTKSGNNSGSGDLENKIISHISEALSIERSLLSPDTKLKDYGVDSLVALQIKGWIDQEFNKQNILNQNQISNGTIVSIVDTIKRKI